MPDIQLIIRTIAEGTGDKELQSSLKELNGAIGVVRSAYQVLDQTYDETIGKAVTYANEVRGLSLVTGQNAENTSRLIQVADDYKLSVDQLTLAHRNLNKNGMSLSIDTLAKLSDEYQTLNAGQEKTEFLMKNFGARGGLAFAEIMSKGGAAIREQSKAIDASLIFDEKKLKAARNLEIAQDNLNDRIQALSLTIGTAAVPAATAWAETIDKLISGQVDWGKEIEQTHGLALIPAVALLKVYGDTANGITAELENTTAAQEELTQSTEDLAAAQEAEIAAAKEVSDTLSGMISLIDSMQSAEERYTAQSKSLTKERADAEADLAKFRAQGYWEQSDQIQGALAKLDEIKAKEAELEKERSRQALQFVSDITAQNLARDGWTQSEFDAFAEQQQAWGLWSADVVEKAKAAWTEADKITESINNIPSTKDITFRVNIEGGSIGGGGGGTTEGTGQGNALDWLTNHGFAQGTGGWMTIPPGYENDSYHMRVESGEKVNVVPAGQSVPQSAGADPALLAAIRESRIDEDRLARTIVSAMMQVSR